MAKSPENPARRNFLINAAFTAGGALVASCGAHPYYTQPPFESHPLQPTEITHYEKLSTAIPAAKATAQSSENLSRIEEAPKEIIDNIFHLETDIGTGTGVLVSNTPNYQSSGRDIITIVTAAHVLKEKIQKVYHPVNGPVDVSPYPQSGLIGPDDIDIAVISFDITNLPKKGIFGRGIIFDANTTPIQPSSDPVDVAIFGYPGHIESPALVAIHTRITVEKSGFAYVISEYGESVLMGHSGSPVVIRQPDDNDLWRVIGIVYAVDWSSTGVFYGNGVNHIIQFPLKSQFAEFIFNSADPLLLPKQ